MYQGISYSVAAMVPAMVQSGLASSLCTITVPPDLVLSPDAAFGPSGAPLASVPYIALTGHVDIPCCAPIASGGGGEQKSEEMIQAKTGFPVTLMGYYPAIIPDYRAMIDSVEYDILAADPDSQRQMTVLLVQKVDI